MVHGYLRTDHWVDSVSALEIAREFCSRVPLDQNYWKWLLIAIHSAVQGFMVLALEQRDSLLVMRSDITEKWLKAYDSGTTYPEERMDFFLNLYDKVKTDDVCRYVGSKKSVPSSSHDYSMKKLNELRNNFIHFFPKGWSIELAGLPTVCQDCLDVSEFLGWESGTIIWHDMGLSKRAIDALKLIRVDLRAVEEVYKTGQSVT